jgi:hypothetical protein
MISRAPTKGDHIMMDSEWICASQLFIAATGSS